MVSCVVLTDNVAFAVMIPTMAAVIIFMFSRFFDSKHLEQAAKTELIFAGSTIFLVLAMIIVLPLMCIVLTNVGNDMLKIVDPASNPNYDNLIDISKAVMAPHVICMRTIMGALYYISTFFEMSATTYIEVFMSEVAGGFIYKMFTERINNTASILTFYTYIYYLIFHILNFIKQTAFTIFLPAGIILRAFPPTRGAGAYVIAFTLGLYFVFPFAFIMMNVAQFDYTHGTMCDITQVPETDHPTSTNFADPTKKSEADSWVKRNMANTESFLDSIYGYVKKLTVSMCLTPLMAMVITLTFVLSTTSLFGGNIPEVGRGLVKLI